jgi:hypothetical protein
MEKKETAEKAVREIRRKTRRRFSAEEKIRIVIEGLRGEESIASLCRREGIASNLYYRWSKEFLEAGDLLPWNRIGVEHLTNLDPLGHSENLPAPFVPRRPESRGSNPRQDTCSSPLESLIRLHVG